jgi:hypothetical protein
MYCLLFRSNILLSSVLFIPLNEFAQGKRMSSNTELQEAFFLGGASSFEVVKSVELLELCIKTKVVVLKT